jgi:hypothetical protein
LLRSYRDKKVVGVFVIFRAPLQVDIQELLLLEQTSAANNTIILLAAGDARKEP